MQDGNGKPRAIRLWRWMIVRHRESGYRLVGHNLATGGPRISSPLVMVDLEWSCAVTETGRMYRLVGSAGPGLAEMRMLDYWQRGYRIPDEDLDIVSLEDAALDLAPAANARPA